MATGARGARYEDLTYTSDGSSITIIGYTGTRGNVIIPNTIDGLPVTGIGESAFYSNQQLAKITLPDSLTEIGTAAFYDCGSLTHVTIPGGVTYIGEEAFANCHSLTSLTLSPGVASIGYDAFGNCTGLTQLAIPGSVTNIGPWAFAYCSGLSGITIPGSVATIGDSAFAYCGGLSRLTLAHGVASIGADAFYDCNSLTNFAIPDSVSSIGGGAFAGCAKLLGITVEAGNTAYSSVDGVLYNKEQTTLVQFPAGRRQLGTLPDTVTRIENSAFSGCRGLTNASIPGGVTEIGTNAFFGCAKLVSITVPGTVTTIGDEAFSCCTNLTAVLFLGDAPSAGVDVFLFDKNPTVYYCSGTSGWSSSFADVPAVLSNPLFEATNGTFSGLFYVASELTHSNSGCITLKTTARGKYSGKLQMGGSSYSFSGSFTYGTGKNVILRKTQNPLSVRLLIPDPESLVGSVQASNETWTAEMSGFRAVFNGRTSLAPQAGRYTMKVEGTNDLTLPAGDGYGALTVSSGGKVTLAGALADGTKISQSAPISRDGQWPLYVCLYRKQGSVMSWITFTNAEVLGGELAWIKPGAATKCYPAGFAWGTQAQGARYRAPGSGINLFGLTSASITLTLTGGGLSQELSHQFTLNGLNRVENLSTTNKLSLSVNRARGLFRGSARNPDTGLMVPFSGVVLQNQTNACGYFLGTNQSGRVLMLGY